MSEAARKQTKFRRCRRQSLCAAMCVLIAITAACSSKGGNQATTSPGGSVSATTAPATASPGAAQAQITIEGEKFPSKVTVSPGGQVTVINKDSTAHTVTSDTAGLFDADVKANSQTTFTAPLNPGPTHITVRSTGRCTVRWSSNSVR